MRPDGFLRRGRSKSAPPPDESHEWHARFRPDVLKGAGQLQVGRWTYWSGEASFRTWRPGDLITIGSFTAIAAGVRIVCGGVHNFEAISGFPFTVMEPGAPVQAEVLEPGRVEIGNDVWLATDAMLLDGARVGDGAIVAAGAVVTGEVPPYAVVAGVPARVIRFRFGEEQVQALLDLRWWDWPDDQIREAIPSLRARDISALREIATRATGESHE